MEEALEGLNALDYAYLGDVVYELYVREYLVRKMRGGVKDMNTQAFHIVNATTQARVVKALKEQLSEAEWNLVKYGRNAKGGSSKSASISDYRYATGLECLLGYLYLKKENERLQQLTDLMIEESIRE